jgi:maleamate amidohydrolase
MTDEGLWSNYAGAFDGRLQPGARLALLVVDAVQAYLEPNSPFYAPAFVDALRSIERLVESARGAKIPVIFTNVVYLADGRNGGHFVRKVPALRVFVEGSPLGRFPPTLQPQPHELIVSKQYASSFFGTSLAATLTSGKIDTLLLCGFSTSGCVRASALDALQHGFIPMVVADACGDRHADPHQANLFDLQAKYAEVVDEAAAVDLIRARH